MSRSNVSVETSIFDEFSLQARRQNKTLFAFGNEWLAAASKISAEGGSPLDMYRLWHSITILKQVDAVTLPSDFVDQLIAKQYLADKEGLLKMFRDVGANLVGFLKIVAPDLDRLFTIAKDFAIMLPLKQFTIVRKSPEKAEISIVGAGRVRESTECTFEFLSSVLNGYGYSITSYDLNVGTIQIWASGTGLHE